MVPERDGQSILFSVAETARALGVSRQAVYSAINSGQLRAEEGGLGKQVHVENLLAYGIQNGKEPLALVNRIQAETDADNRELLLWVIGGLGLFILIKTLLGK